MASIDGKSYTFNINSATLLRSIQFKEKRLDIAGTVTDAAKRLLITLGEETHQRNAMSVKKYILNAYPDDDPSTLNIDESLSTQGFSTYGTALGNNWVYEVYGENGSFTVTSCNASTTLISGTFKSTRVDLNDSSHVVKITAGKLTNVKYMVVN